MIGGTWRSPFGVPTVLGQWMVPFFWLLLLTWVIHGSALQGHWRIDDPLVLLHLLKQPSAWADFLSPEAWRQLDVPFFTPLLVLEYRIDYAIFGLEPSGHYARHLFTLALCAFFSYRLLRLTTGHWTALLGASVFLFGAPVVVVAQQLMARHYATGLALALLACLTWIRSQDRSSFRWVGALLYLLALCCKEVFLPLPLLLLFGSSGPLLVRAIKLWPMYVAALTFLSWRALMLGNVVGGYSGELLPLSSVGSSVATWLPVIAGSGWPMWLAMFLLAVGLTRWVADSPVLRSTFIAATLLALSLPFLGVRGSTDITLYRFSFLPWWAFSMAIGLGAHALSRPSTFEPNRLYGWQPFVSILIVAGIATPVAIAGRMAHQSAAERHLPYDIQGRFIWSHSEKSSLVLGAEPASVIQFQYAMSALKRLTRGLDSPTLIPHARLWSMLGGGPDLHVFDPECLCIRRESSVDTQPARQLTAPIVTMWRPPVGLGWRVGSPDIETMRCHLFSRDLNVSVWIPCEGVLHYGPPAWLSGSFRMVLLDPTGDRWAVSPPLGFPSRGEAVCWPPTTSCASNRSSL